MGLRLLNATHLRGKTVSLPGGISAKWLKEVTHHPVRLRRGGVAQGPKGELGFRYDAGLVEIKEVRNVSPAGCVLRVSGSHGILSPCTFAVKAARSPMHKLQCMR